MLTFQRKNNINFLPAATGGVTPEEGNPELRHSEYESRVLFPSLSLIRCKMSLAEKDIVHAPLCNFIFEGYPRANRWGGQSNFALVA